MQESFPEITKSQYSEENGKKRDNRGNEKSKIHEDHLRVLVGNVDL